MNNSVKNQNEPHPIVAKEKVEKRTTNVLNPVVKDFLFMPTKTDVDKAPIAMKLKITSNKSKTTAIASNTLIQIKIIPRIRIANKNKLNSSSSTVAVCKKYMIEFINVKCL